MRKTEIEVGYGCLFRPQTGSFATCAQKVDVKLEEQSKNDDGTIDYLYTTTFKVYDENSSKIYEKEGELTISTKNNELKIDRDWSRGVKIDGLDGGL
jgi:hypothetical protein